jgi:hypothetical protein
MGSANSKSRKPKQQHLPKVGTAQNRAYEERERANVAWDLSKWWMLAIVVGIVLTMVVLYFMFR